ncbi:MAG: TonB-dependent receptor, partial [Acidobacteria bacterium]|nr:TonB-dependent receptor [Acidobacteriota bacterium]
MKTLVTRSVLSVLPLVVVLPLLAQTPAPAPAPAPAPQPAAAPTAEEEKKSKLTEEMVVTARKREETVQDVPISVAAPTESELRDRGAE